MGMRPPRAETAPIRSPSSQQHQTNAFQIGVTEGAQAKADELGVELNILSADQDAAKQISQIEQCVSEGYDAILFEPVDPDGLRDAAKAAADAGVIMINIVPPAPTGSPPASLPCPAATTSRPARMRCSM